MPARLFLTPVLFRQDPRFLMKNRAVHEMRGLLLPLALIVSIIAVAPAAVGADAKGDFAVHGIGTQSCKDFAETIAKDANSAALAESWIMGYLSAVNRTALQTFDAVPGIDAAALSQIVANICLQHPDAKVEVAVDGVLRSLSAARVKTTSPLVAARSGTASVTTYLSVVKAVEQRLVDEGYLKVLPGGKYSSNIDVALKAYQTDHKLTASGLPDAATVVQLLATAPTASVGKPAPAPAPAKHKRK